MGEQQCHSNSIRMNHLQCHTLSAFCVQIPVLHTLQCLTNSIYIGSFQLNLGDYYMQMPISRSSTMNHTFFFPKGMRWQRCHRSQVTIFNKSKYKEHFQGKDSAISFFFFKLLNNYVVAKTRGIMYMKITFLYKRQILVLHYFDSKILIISLSNNR